MKTANRHIVDLTWLLLKQKKLKIGLLLIVFAHTLFAENIDIGLFESTSPDQIDVKIKPDFDIAGDETITAILYTVRWNDPSIAITTEFIFPFFIAPQGDPEEYNGYYYQVFAAVPVNAQAMVANETYLASSFTYTNGECASFEIIEDDWTQMNNGNFYIEFLGGDVTGIIFEPMIEFGPVGGEVNGGGTINLGEPTGNLTLFSYSGNINTWQKRLNEGSWYDIPSTNGLINYSETPVIAGSWEYRCKVQLGDCPIVYSDAAVITVLDTITGTFAGITIDRNKIEIYHNELGIHLQNSNSKSLNGDLKVFNLLGQKIYEKHISGIKTHCFNINSNGILIVIFLDKTTKILHKEKVLIK